MWACVLAHSRTMGSDHPRRLFTQSNMRELDVIRADKQRVDLDEISAAATDGTVSGARCAQCFSYCAQCAGASSVDDGWHACMCAPTRVRAMAADDDVGVRAHVVPRPVSAGQPGGQVRHGMQCTVKRFASWAASHSCCVHFVRHWLPLFHCAMAERRKGLSCRKAGVDERWRREAKLRMPVAAGRRRKEGVRRRGQTLDFLSWKMSRWEAGQSRACWAMAVTTA